MKMKPEHFQHLKDAVDRVLANNPTAVERYRAGQFPNADKVKNLQQRFNFDLLRAAVPPRWICDNLYPYLDDTHIATSLRSICPKVTD